MKKIGQIIIAVFFFVLPFERIPTLEFHGFTMKISYLLGLLVLGWGLFSFKPFWKTKFSSDEKFLGLFWLLASFSTLLFAPDKARGIIILLMWAFVFLLYLVLSRKLESSQIKKIEDIIIFSAVATSLFGLYQFVGDSLGLSANHTFLLERYTKVILGFPRVQSVGLEPLYYANFLFVPIFILMSRIVSERNKKQLAILLVSLLPISVAFILTVSRGAYIGLIFSLILFLVFLLINKRFSQIGWLLLVWIIGLSISFAVVNSLNGSGASQTAVSHSVDYAGNVNSDGSAMDRIGTYKLAFQYFKEKPLLGNGLASFGVKFTPRFVREKGLFQTVNNEYLELLAENGLAGLLLFFLFIGSFFVFVFKKYKSAGLDKKIMLVALACGIIAIGVQYNFFSTLYIIYIWAFLALIKAEAMQN